MVNDNTRGYSVYISDEYNSIQGSGVLFYVGGENVFVFTCAHVVDSIKKVRLLILKEIDSSRDLYNVLKTEVPITQIFYSPLDQVITDDSGRKIHSEDIAIIQIKKPKDCDFDITNYFVTETYRNCSVYVQGYPNGVPDVGKAIEYLDCLHGHVIVNCTYSNRFTIRMDDSFLDASARVLELEGLSGSPVWDDNKEFNGLLGLFTSAYGTTALLAKIYVTKAEQLRSIMKERFDITIERKLEGIPEEDVAGVALTPISFNGTIEITEEKENETWIKEQLSGLRLIIEDLKLQKAIDRGKEIIVDSRYANLSREYKRKTKHYLLFCYEIADLDERFEELESEMRKEGLVKEHETLRRFTRTFMKRQFQETVDTAQQYINACDGSGRDSLLSCAKAFLLLAKAYTENLPVVDTIGKLLDENENFIFPTDDIEEEALVYQMIGYVYGEHYHDYVNSVRFLNRSYRIGYDNIVLESLGAAYYQLGICNAIDEKGRISDLRKIDEKALYKARECFLMIKSKADELFWAGTIRRVGMCVFNTFVFLRDNYRVLTVFQDIKKYLTNLSNDEWRDVEMKYARIKVLKGEIDTKEFQHITTEDSILLEAMAKAHKCYNLIEDLKANNYDGQMNNLPITEKDIRDTLKYLENAVEHIDYKERTQIYVHIINLYAQGMMLYGWNKKDKLKSLYEMLSVSSDTDLLESVENFIFEIDAPIELAEKRYKASFEKHKNLVFWQELNHMYIRHGLLEKADDMYKELLSKRKELFRGSPEYVYRAFMDYVTFYKRDLKYALQCYIDAKEAFQDTDIEGFWELELAFYSNSFNEPERFLLERKHFVDKGLISEENYRRAAFIAYLTNLNKVEAEKQMNYIIQYPHCVDAKTGRIILSKEETHFLNWVSAIQANFLLAPDSMSKKRAEEVTKVYESETWHREINKSLKNQFGLNKTIAIDAWSLYQLAENNVLDTLEELDCVYVSHKSIIRFLEELSIMNNIRIRILLDYIELSTKIKIYSANFKAQLEVRNLVQYFEPASAMAIAVEKDCLMVYGEPTVDEQLVGYFGDRIIRVNEFEKLLNSI